MKDISFHILDIVQNSLHAHATKVEIGLHEEGKTGQLKLVIMDNGDGMDAETVRSVTDPFFTSSEKKKVGLGLPLLKQNAEQTGGSFDIQSGPGIGTNVTVLFWKDHIDMIPMGDVALTIRTLIAGDPGVDFIYRRSVDGEGFELDTSMIRKELDNVPLNQREVLDYIVEILKSNEERLPRPQESGSQ
jgi:hypothetical protein